MRASAITVTDSQISKRTTELLRTDALSQSSSGISDWEKEAAALKALGYFLSQISGFYFAFSQLPVWGLFYFLCSAVEQLSFVLAL